MFFCLSVYLSVCFLVCAFAYVSFVCSFARVFVVCLCPGFGVCLSVCLLFGPWFVRFPVCLLFVSLSISLFPGLSVVCVFVVCFLVCSFSRVLFVSWSISLFPGLFVFLCSSFVCFLVCSFACVLFVSLFISLFSGLFVCLCVCCLFLCFFVCNMFLCSLVCSFARLSVRSFFCLSFLYQNLFYFLLCPFVSSVLAHCSLLSFSSGDDSMVFHLQSKG